MRPTIPGWCRRRLWRGFRRSPRGSTSWWRPGFSGGSDPMHGGGWLVLLGGIAAIAWVNWYFFFAGQHPTAGAPGAGGIQEVTVVVHGGYSPDEVRVRQGAPVRIVFDPREHPGGPGAGGIQEVTVVVHGGYSPDEVRVRQGAPLRIVFDRRETSGCTEEVVFPDFAIHRFLPPERKTPIEIVPPAPGSYEFTCGMGMFRGKVIVE